MSLVSYMNSVSLPPRIRRAANRFTTAFGLPAYVKVTLLPTWAMLGVSRAAILAVQFKRLAPRLGVDLGPFFAVPLVTPEQERRARQIQSVIALAARYTPWTSNCFPQAIVARVLLGMSGIPYTLFFGVAREDNTKEIQAHAWVCSGPVFVSGGRGAHRFTIVRAFASSDVSRAMSASS